MGGALAGASEAGSQSLIEIWYNGGKERLWRSCFSWALLCQILTSLRPATNKSGYAPKLMPGSDAPFARRSSARAAVSVGHWPLENSPPFEPKPKLTLSVNLSGSNPLHTITDINPATTPTCTIRLLPPSLHPTERRRLGPASAFRTRGSRSLSAFDREKVDEWGMSGVEEGEERAEKGLEWSGSDISGSWTQG